VGDPVLALDLDLAIAERCHRHEQDALAALLKDEQGGFFSAVVQLLNR